VSLPFTFSISIQHGANLLQNLTGFYLRLNKPAIVILNSLKSINLFLQKSLILDTNSLILILVILFCVGGGILYLLFAKNTSKDKPLTSDGTASAQMQLQAYERLILLTDRIALPNLISRVNQPGTTARETQYLLTQSIKEEYSHNITQQIYVSADAWTAVKNLKEQNMLIINQLANVLPPNANGMDLNKLLLEYVMTDKKGSMHEVVSEVLSFEAKKVL